VNILINLTIAKNTMVVRIYWVVSSSDLEPALASLTRPSI
jgi:hypothetical protein